MPFPNRPQSSTGSPSRPGMVSSSAPPSFRAKKKRPGMVDSMGHADTAGEVNPMPQNSGRMTGPPIQMGAGKGSMFADGRTGQPQGMVPRTPNYPQGGPGPMRVQGQPQSSLPPGTPNYPKMGPGPSRVSGQVQGMHPRGVPTATKMMADGGMGDPEPIGGMPDDQNAGAPDMDDSQTPPMGGGGEMPVISPTAVAYHDDAQNCQGCQFFGSGGQCQVLQMAVAPEGGCTAFQAGTGGQPDQGMTPSMGGATDQNDEGTSGAPSLS